MIRERSAPGHAWPRTTIEGGAGGGNGALGVGV
jgi:hypothetical protein